MNILFGLIEDSKMTTGQCCIAMAEHLMCLAKNRLVIDFTLSCKWLIDNLDNERACGTLSFYLTEINDPDEYHMIIFLCLCLLPNSATLSLLSIFFQGQKDGDYYFNLHKSFIRHTE